ncbi:fatty acid hydroxylase family protein [Corallococcus sp. H22C18031201]|nr:fatty acid hydroxylase family protein [Corallococcus sp. H22C18031201]
MGEPHIPKRVTEFREAYRRQSVSPRYSGWGHLAFTSLSCLGGLSLALSWLERPRPLELLTVPGVILLANGVEFLGHRGPMHRRRRGLGAVFERHTGQHHRFFTHQSMQTESSRDFKLVLFPPVLLAFFLGAIALPLGALGFVLASANVGLLFVATALGYYLAYEWLHLSYHLPAGHPILRWPGLTWLRAHHQVHHDPSRMTRVHFNLTFPLADFLFGTMWRPTRRGSAGPEAPRARVARRPRPSA